jgi:hypothetical protein
MESVCNRHKYSLYRLEAENNISVRPQVAASKLCVVENGGCRREQGQMKEFRNLNPHFQIRHYIARLALDNSSEMFLFKVFTSVTSPFPNETATTTTKSAANR